MDRSAEILEKGRELLSGRARERSGELTDFSGAAWNECRQAFLQEINQLFASAAAAQKEQKKNPIRYMIISPLLSSRVIGTYEYQIALCDKRLYLDNNDSSRYWCPAFLFAYFKQDLAYFSKEIKRRVVRVRDDEILAFANVYVEYYEAIAEAFFRQTANEIRHVENYAKLTKERTVEILFGGYMDKAETIAAFTEEAKAP